MKFRKRCQKFKYPKIFIKALGTNAKLSSFPIILLSHGYSIDEDIATTGTFK